jgi:uncharacterized protein YjbI with pentapeptide repeats
MNAREVLNRYAAGERDFRRANLRGQSFKGQDLSGADFSEADIRGTNFTHAILREANFSNARAGVPKRWWWVQQGLAFLISALSSCLSAFAGALIAALLFDQSQDSGQRQAYFIAGLMVLGVMVVVFGAIARQGFTSKAAGTIAIAVAIAVAVAVAVAVAFAVAVAVAFAFAGAFAVAVAVAGAVAVATLLLGLYCRRRAHRGDEKFAVIRSVGVAFGALGGTSFCGADLTRANFSRALLRRTHFNATKQHPTILEWVNWQDAQKLDFARVGNSLLANPAVRDLLVTRNGYQKSYVDANLRRTNLNGVNLHEANLTWADLSAATLHQADLRGADLTEALVLGTDFTGVALTAACLEAWNIDSHTNLEEVDCQFVYLLRHQQERRPSSGDFAPGEFTKLFQEVLSTVDLIFRNGIDWKAFTYSFNQLVLENADTELTIQSIENKGDGVVVVRVNAPPDADKAKLHSEFNQTYAAAVQALEANYHAQLQAKDEQITLYRQQSADMLEITRLMANRPINVQAIAESKSMSNSSESSQTVNIGGNVTGSTINLGTLSGNVTNTINQLPHDSDPNQPNLKDLLTQLQAAIEAEPSLPDGDKADLLEQVQHLAAAKQTAEPAQKAGLVRKAKKMFEVTLQSLPDTAKIAEACSKLLPLILKALGM